MNILNRLTIKHLKMNKKRTIVTIIGVILSTALMVGIGLLFSTVRDNAVKMTIQDNGPQHVILEEVDYNKYNILSQNVKVKNVEYTRSLGYAAISKQDKLYKNFIQVTSASDGMFDTFHLIEGRLPENENEIIVPESLANALSYQIGDTWSMNVGDRAVYDGDYEGNDYEDWLTGTTIQNGITKNYKIVGIMKRSYTERYEEDYYEIFTVDTKDSIAKMDAYVIYKNPKDTYKVSEVLAKNAGMEEKKDENGEMYLAGIQPNSSLLSLSGVSNYNNFNSSMGQIIMIILTLVSIGCIVVIYNSFAISVMERKKQFGLFASIGTTRSQLRKTVFFEAIIVGIIGIPLGIVGSFIGIGAVISIINQLLPDAFQVPLALSAYPLFLIIPIIFMIVTILISAYLPARKASKITPIEAIRQNDDIKIRGKKIKTHKWIRKLFGMEGELALKNMKRNKRKYRITIVSLFVSIVLFISFSAILYYGFTSAIDYAGVPNFDIVVGVQDSDYKLIDQTIDNFKNHEQIDEILMVDEASYYTRDITLDHFNSKFIEKTDYKLEKGESTPVKVLGMDQKNYDAYKKQIGITKDQPIVFNYYKGVFYGDNTRTSISMPKYNSVPTINLCLYNGKNDTVDPEMKPDMICNHKIENAVLTEKSPMGFDSYIDNSGLVIVISETMFKELNVINDYNEASNGVDGTIQNYNKQIFINAKNYDQLDKKINSILDNPVVSEFYYANMKENMKIMQNIVLVIKILLYGFIGLVTLIGVTSVFNTINTSMNLRRKEFAMLRSMGLTPKGFNKILSLESLFFGLKSLLYALPVSIVIVYILYLSFGNIVEQKFVLPWDSILIAVIGVFIIVFITMRYASSKIKHENILDAIREENI